MEKNNDIIIKELQELRQDVRLIGTDIVDLKVIQGQNKVILQEHIRRTEANERLIETVKGEISRRIDKLESFKWYFGGIAVLMTIAIEVFRRVM